MLQEFIAEKHVTLNAIVGLYPANAVGDDIEVYSDESRTTVRATLYGLRQQAEKDSKGDPCVVILSRILSCCLPNV
jgi:5-methyltetrahydrofolate--homocysteine methyltransferase